jgi:hypothetical protein
VSFYCYFKYEEIQSAASNLRFAGSAKTLTNKVLFNDTKDTLYPWFYPPFIIPLLQGVWAPFATNFLYPLLSVAHIYLVNTFRHILSLRLVSSFQHSLSFSPFFSLLKEELWKIGNVLWNVNHLAKTATRFSAEEWEWRYGEGGWWRWQIRESDERAVDLSKSLSSRKNAESRIIFWNALLWLSVSLQKKSFIYNTCTL